LFSHDGWFNKTRLYINYFNKKKSYFVLIHVVYINKKREKNLNSELYNVNYACTLTDNRPRRLAILKATILESKTPTAHNIARDGGLHYTTTHQKHVTITTVYGLKGTLHLAIIWYETGR